MSQEMVKFLEKSINWTLPGCQLFYRDTAADIDVEKAYPVGLDKDGKHLPLDFMMPPEYVKALSDGIRKIAEDTDEINYPKEYSHEYHS